MNSNLALCFSKLHSYRHKILGLSKDPQEIWNQIPSAQTSTLLMSLREAKEILESFYKNITFRDRKDF